MGLDLLVETASIYMSLWDKDFLDRIRKLGLTLKMYKWYVDDICIVLDAVNPEWYFCKRQKKLVYDLNHPNVNMEADARTFQLLADLANTLDPKIQMTFEVPSLTGNGRLPVLDLEIFVVQNRMEFSFYKKPIASQFTIMFKSALSKQTKQK